MSYLAVEKVMRVVLFSVNSGFIFGVYLHCIPRIITDMTDVTSSVMLSFFMNWSVKIVSLMEWLQGWHSGFHFNLYFMCLYFMYLYLCICILCIWILCICIFQPFNFLGDKPLVEVVGGDASSHEDAVADLQAGVVHPGHDHHHVDHYHHQKIILVKMHRTKNYLGTFMLTRTTVPLTRSEFVRLELHLFALGPLAMTAMIVFLYSITPTCRWNRWTCWVGVGAELLLKDPSEFSSFVPPWKGIFL